MQKREMTEVTLKHKGVFLPFIAADPRRIRYYKKKGNANDPHGIKYITDALERQGFWGVKIYPPLGYLPNNSFLRPLYKYCEAKEIPITAHCLYGGFYSAQDVPGDKRKSPKKSVYYWGMANPLNWKPVLDRYPNLKLNLAHFGGDIFGKKKLFFKDRDQIRIEKEWRKTIVSYLKQYNNAYADLAYIEAMFCDPDNYFKRLKKYSLNNKIWKKILYGTDWWANRTLCSESEHLETFSGLAKKHKIRDDQISCLLRNNAVEFLGLNNPASGPLFNHINFLAGRGAMLPTWFKFS
ncbi:MAG: amidohydrolase [Candidatus Scalindua rubra]|uniref:Amidohydrolase n=1 Tax=Candidatus Scalindua rubra TaxID=1872076 RepID=A0A1E3X4S3_9BACT|nr:MAG: amidohydrolase [Candidatus Scalindua rubra]